jgi:cytochrome d ubiquinol oxidase subunit II
MLLTLLALILRPVGFDYRGKINNEIWRKFWDGAIFISGIVPALIFGIALGNTLCGVSFDFDEFVVMKNQITFFDLFSPFSLLCGALSVLMMITHGACYLAIKIDGEILRRVKKILKITPILMIILFACGGFFLKIIPSYSLENNELVTSSIGNWFDNYQKYNWFLIAPIFGFAGQILLMIFNHKNHTKKAFFCSSLSIAGIIASVGLTMFPFILPSSLNPNASLTIWNSSSSEFTLFVMLIATIIFVPLIMIYTSWVYYIMRGKVTTSDVEKDSKFLY